MIVVQTFNRAGWPPNSTIELEDAPAAALFTAVRDYEAEKHLSLHGDYLAAPVGGDRTMAEVVEMRSAFRAPRTSELWLTIGRDKYNMDPDSTAIPSLTSPHLDGYCMDFSNNGFLAWLKSPDPRRPGHNIAARYGLVFTLLKENDLRHAQFFPGTATAALDVTSLDGGAVAPARRKPMDWTLYWLSYKKRADGTNVYYRGYPGTGVMEDTLFSQDQANREVRRTGAAAIELKSDVDVAAEVVVLKTHRASSPGGSTDLAPVLQAIAAGEAQDVDSLKQILAAIGQVDEATLATFGLKRA